MYNCAQPPYDQWPKMFAKIQAGLLEGAARVGAKLVAAENLYMYGSVSGPIHEGLPYAASTHKGAVRARMAEQLMEAHHDGRVRTVAGRASDYFGPGVESSFIGALVFRRVAGGRPVYLLGDMDRLHTYTFVGDFARALVTLGENAAADGQAWHVPSSPTLTTRAFVELIGAFRRSGSPIVFVRHDSTERDSPLRPGQPGNAFQACVHGEPDLLVTKHVNSAFLGDPPLARWLHDRGIARIAVCGISTNHCCETTARMGANLGFDVRFVLDATHTFDRIGLDGKVVPAELLAEVTAANLQGEFATVVSTDEVIRSLVPFAASEAITTRSATADRS